MLYIRLRYRQVGPPVPLSLHRAFKSFILFPVHLIPSTSVVLVTRFIHLLFHPNRFLKQPTSPKLST